MQEFISEDDLQTFEGWLKYQAVDAATTEPEQLENWRRIFEDARERAAASPKVGLMKLQPVPGEYRYAVAIREDGNLWLTLWVRRSWKGEFFVMVPRGDAFAITRSTPGGKPKKQDWNPHTSYHLDGTLHIKSYDRRILSAQKRQPLTGTFRGSVDLGVYAGHGPKGVGAICDPTAFSGVVEVAPGVLGPRHGAVKVDLVEPGHEPERFDWAKIVTQQVFRDILPWVVITVGSCG